MDSEGYEDLREQFRKVFAAKWKVTELSDQEELCERFAFHMADSSENLSTLVSTCEKYDELSSLIDIVELFFNHALPHLIAAAQIYDSVPQVFEEQQGVHNWEEHVDHDEDIIE